MKYQPINSYPENVQRETIARLWAHMAAHFGEPWRRNFGEPGGPSSAVWLDGLRDMTMDQLKRGLDGLRDWPSAFPPNLGEFRKLCLTQRPVEQRRNFTEERIEGKTELMTTLRKGAKTPIAKEELAKIERIMAGEDIETREESYRKLNLARRWGGLVLAIVLSGCACHQSAGDVAWALGHVVMGNPDVAAAELLLNEAMTDCK